MAEPQSRPATICLWYDKDAADAARFYEGLFPDAKITAVQKAPADYPSGKAGDVLLVTMDMLGMGFLLMNGGPVTSPTMSYSLQVHTDTQEETDRLWDAITAEGKESACGWCVDRWGYYWQITPRALTQGLADPDPAAAQRVMEAMMGMVKIDITAIEAARAGR